MRLAGRGGWRRRVGVRPVVARWLRPARPRPRGPCPDTVDLSGVAAVVLLQAVQADAEALLTEGSPVQAAGPAAAGVGFPITRFRHDSNSFRRAPVRNPV
jgi:hypothetical protein